MEISSRDKKLLVYLIAVGIIAGTYFFGAKPFMDKQETLNTEVEDLKSKINHYSEIYQNKENYENQIVDAEEKYEELIARFNGDIKQENTIMLTRKLEKETGVWISKIVFMEPIGSDSSEQSGDVEGEAVEAAPSGVKQDLSLEFNASYDNFKKFINYVKDYDKRLYISSLTSTYSVDSNNITGTLTLSQFALPGAEIEDEVPDLSSVSIGTQNIFTNFRPISDGIELNVETLTDSDNENPSEGLEEASESSDNEDNNGEEDAN